jgi:uncharacterized membrane protein YedE/YeeE
MTRTLQLPYLAVAAIAGPVFGVGLYVSQMINPLKVLHFLDFTAIPSGRWDPSLAFVMGAGLIVMFAAVRIGKRRGQPVFDTRFHEPQYNRIDTRLVAGAAIFGIGWGMSGICPGPAISLIGFWPQNLLVYLLALFVGSYGAAFLPTGSHRSLAAAQ